MLSLNLHPSPLEHVLLTGTLHDIPLGLLHPQEAKTHWIQMVFGAEGRFGVVAEVWGYAGVRKEGAPCGRGEMSVLARVEG